ncbi:hypothetical protein T484DRAFT_1823473 [Baffinella frigidus]|nr:hypothetical protein T484DRAFT_1823473 [Cryptophyta sp. CCMP2293]
MSGSPRREREDASARARALDRAVGVAAGVVAGVMIDEGAVAYLLGRNGTTKQRLANFSGARLEIDPRADGGGTVEIIGSDDERRLARICIDITLQQRNNGKASSSPVKVDLEGLRALGEITHFDVDQSAVGFVLGAKGATLRQFEKMYRTFMFFDNDTVVEGGKKRLYILGTRHATINHKP